MKTIKYITLIISLSLIFAGTTSNVYAAGVGNNVSTIALSTSAKQGACNGLNQLDNSTSCSTTSNATVTSITGLVINILSIVIGIVSVIVIIFAGFRFVTANGDSNAISSARNTLIYAIVGLVIAVLAQVIASNVLNSASQIKTGYINETVFNRDV